MNVYEKRILPRLIAYIALLWYGFSKGFFEHLGGFDLVSPQSQYLKIKNQRCTSGKYKQRQHRNALQNMYTSHSILSVFPSKLRNDVFFMPARLRLGDHVIVLHMLGNESIQRLTSTKHTPFNTELSLGYGVGQ